MSFWRKYIVMRDKRSAAKGQVKLGANGMRMDVAAKVTLKEGRYLLLLFGRGFTHCLPMEYENKTTTCQRSLPIPQDERILAAVMQHDKMLLLGESDGSISPWDKVAADTAAMSINHSKKQQQKAKAKIEPEAIAPEEPAQQEEAPDKPELRITMEQPVDEEVEEDIAEIEAEAPTEAAKEEDAEEETPQEAAPEIPLDIEPDTGEKRVFGPEGAISLEEYTQDTFPAIEGEYQGLWEWESISVPGSGFNYLLGKVESDGQVVAVAVAVPGEYAPAPPPNLTGFSGYSCGY